MPGLCEKEAFQDYRINTAYKTREPNLEKKGDDDELRLITEWEGVLVMSPSPAEGKAHSDRCDGKAKYLWVITPESLPMALENNEAAGRTVPYQLFKKWVRVLPRKPRT